jgi:hypothetical protein
VRRRMNDSGNRAACPRGKGRKSRAATSAGAVAFADTDENH